MNQAHYHLILNHLPIISPIIGFLVLIGGHVFRADLIKRVAYAIFILGALCTIPAFATGEGAEEVIENLSGVSEQIIKTHEESADTFASLSYVLGLLSLIGLWAYWKQKSLANHLSIAILLFCVIVLLSAKKTGTTGGEIRHTEIRVGSDLNATENKNEKDE